MNGPDLVLGSLTDVSTNGNWPTTFDVETNNANSTHLDICLGDDYVSIKTLNSDKSSFSDFTLEKKLKTGSLSDFLDNILSEKNIYELNVENVNVHFDNDLFCLVPNELF